MLTKRVIPCLDDSSAREMRQWRISSENGRPLAGAPALDSPKAKTNIHA